MGHAATIAQKAPASITETSFLCNPTVVAISSIA